MRTLEKKVFQKLKKEGISKDNVLEILDRISREEMKKSYPDECHFQKHSYFADLILKALVRYQLIKKTGHTWEKIKKEN